MKEKMGKVNGKNRIEKTSGGKARALGFVKYVNIGILAVLVAVVGSYAWFNTNKVPNAVDLAITDPTATLKIEIYDPHSETYSVVHEEDVNDFSKGTFEVGLPEMTFFKWEDSVISSVTEKLHYRITVTSRFDTGHFSGLPLLSVTPFFETEASDELLEEIDIMIVEYLVNDPTTVKQYNDVFPAAGFELMPLHNSPEDALLFEEVDVLNIGGAERFQSVIYIMVDADTAAIADVIEQLGISMVPHWADNSLLLKFAFRSTPFYTPEPPIEPEDPEDPEDPEEPEETPEI